MVDPVNGSAQYTYDSVGNILSVVRRPITDVVVAQVSPIRAAAGTSVAISGTGFGTTANTTVSFNGTAATPTAVTATQITVTVPSGATTGPISVTAPAGTAASAAPFSILTSAAPVVSSFSPTKVDQGSTITITGSGFDTTLSNNKVLINGRYAGVLTATATQITASTPAVGSGKVTVVTSAGSKTSTGDLTVPPLPYLASNSSTVTRSSLGSSPSVTVNASGQYGLILFDAAAGQRMSAQVTSSSFGNGQVYLYGPDGSQIGGGASLTTDGFLDLKTLAQSGTYTLLVAPASGTGSATIKLNDVPSDATATIVANGSPVSVTTTVPGQNMRATFTATNGQRLALKTEIPAGGAIDNAPCSYLAILYPDGVNPFYSNNCFNYPRNWQEFNISYPGNYNIVVDPATNPIGSVTFTLYTMPDDATATIAADANPVTVTTTAPGQNMKLTFTGTANQKIGLKIEMPQGGPVDNAPCSSLQVLQPDGTTVAYSDGCFNVPYRWAELTLPASGTYSILADVAEDAVGSVTFTLYNIPADATATVAADANPVTVTTTVPGQNMKLTFAGTANQKIGLKTQMTGGGPIDNAPCSPLRVLQPDGTTTLYLDGCFNVDYRWAEMTLPVAGTYTILVDIADSAVGSVTFTLYTIPADAAATITVGGAAVPVTTTAAGQNMRLTFTGAANKKVSLKVDMTVGGAIDNAPCSPLQILQPDGTTVLYYDGCFNDTPPRFSDVVILPVAGTYTIFADIAGEAAGTATFTLYDATEQVATITPGGASVALTVAQPGQNGQLNFTGTQGTRLALLSQFDASLASGCSNVRVVQPDGTTRLYDYRLCGTSAFSDPLPTPAAVSTTIPTLPVSGAYKVLLNPEGTATGTATFTLYSVPADVTGTRTLGQAAANFSTTVPGQAIRVTFAGQSGQSATVNVGVVSSNPASPCYRITTLAPDGTTIVRGDQSCSSGYSSGSLSLTQGGNYTVVVDPGDVAVGTFSVGVTTP